MAPASHPQPERIAPGIFVSKSGRTAFKTDADGLEKIAEEHEWMRDRIASLELKNAFLRSVVELTPPRPVICGTHAA